MSIKLMVLYPNPADQAAFEQQYHGKHMPLMRSIITPASRVPTYRVRHGAALPFYRVAEIHFENAAELEAFVSSEAAHRARQSSEAVSTGGKPLLLVCDQDALPPA